MNHKLTIMVHRLYPIPPPARSNKEQDGIGVDCGSSIWSGDATNCWSYCGPFEIEIWSAETLYDNGGLGCGFFLDCAGVVEGDCELFCYGEGDDKNIQYCFGRGEYLLFGFRH